MKSALPIVEDTIKYSEKIYGPSSSQYAHALFLKAKTLMLKGNETQALSTETKEAIDQAILIEEGLQKDQPLKNSILGRYYYCAGSIYQGANDIAAALSLFRKSIQIINTIQGLEPLSQEIETQIQKCEEELGQNNGQAQRSNTIDGEELSKVESKQVDDDEPLTDYLIMGAIGFAVIGAIAFAVQRFRKN